MYGVFVYDVGGNCRCARLRMKGNEESKEESNQIEWNEEPNHNPSASEQGHRQDSMRSHIQRRIYSNHSRMVLRHVRLSPSRFVSRLIVSFVRMSE